MTKYSNLTIGQIRNALSHMEKNYSFAMDAKAYGLATALKDKIDGLMIELVKRIRSEDQYTTEADVHYFESHSAGA